MSSPATSQLIPDAILWHDGMLLTPEHFYELQARGEAMLEAVCASLRYFWGVRRLQLDQAQLSQGKVVFLELAAVLPDGFYVRVLRSEDAPLAIDLGLLDASFQQQPFLLYLAVNAPGGEGSDVRKQRFLEMAGDARLESMVEEDAEAAPIPRLRPRFHLLASLDPPSSKFVSMPIARVAVRNEVWVTLDDYQPPVNTLPAGSRLLTETENILRRMREMAIAQHTRWERLGAEEQQAFDTGQRDAWRAVVMRLPALEALVLTRIVPPFELYLALCTLAGAAAGLMAQAVPPLFPPYRHEDIAASFAPVLQYLTGMLNREQGNAFDGFPFRFDRDLFSLLFAPEWAGRRLLLAVRSPREDEGSSRAWIDAALIGSQSLQKSMRDRRILGAARTFAATEHGLMTQPGTTLFVLGENSEFIRPGEVLEIRSGPHTETGRQPLEINLFVRNEA